MKFAMSEKIALLLHPHVDVPYSLVVTYNLTLDGKLCLHDDKNGNKSALTKAHLPGLGLELGYG